MMIEEKKKIKQKRVYVKCICYVYKKRGGEKERKKKKKDECYFILLMLKKWGESKINKYEI